MRAEEEFECFVGALAGGDEDTFEVGRIDEF